MVVDDLQEVVLRVLEDHEDAFRFEDDFHKVYECRVAELSAERHLADRGLRDASVLELALPCPA